MAPFFVLLGPDYAGKSTVMSALRHSMPEWRFASLDDDLLSPGYKPISELLRALAATAGDNAAGQCSADFAIAVLQTGVVHLRDQLASQDHRPFLVDSYYYKTLAKCRLMTGQEHPMFGWWRSFPQPRRVFYLDVPPESAWRRSRHGNAVNRFEHYGERPCLASFRSFQADLRKLMLEEVSDVPVSLVNGDGTVARTTRELKEMMTRELA
jgi:thymidylate kinase